MNKKLIVLELNEVPNRVIEHYIRKHPNGALAEIFSRSARFTAATPDQIQLHPKISWQTFHRGVEDNRHGFVEYNQIDAPGADKYPPVWEILRRSGVEVGVGASIGSYPVPNDLHNLAFYLPEPFAPTDHTLPHYLSGFQQLNIRAVQHSQRVVRKGGLNLDTLKNFVLNTPRLGISPATTLKIARQLAAEKKNPARIVRRRTLQALMTFDICLRQVSKSKPEFATIFSNHVASSMHRYWAATFPDDYKQNNMPAEWRKTYGGEIEYAMGETDYMLGKLQAFQKSNPEYRVMVIASMGQEAIEHEVVRNQLMIRDFGKFMQALGFDASEYTHLAGMEPEYVVRFHSPELFNRFVEVCETVSINGKSPLVKPSNDEQCAFLVEHTNVEFDHLMAGNRQVSLEDAGIVIEPIQDMSGSTAQHIPGGCCFVFDGDADLSHLSQTDEDIDLCSVTASILQAHGVEVPDYMPAPTASLVEALSPGSSHESFLKSDSQSSTPAVQLQS